MHSLNNLCFGQTILLALEIGVAFLILNQHVSVYTDEVPLCNLDPE